LLPQGPEPAARGETDSGGGSG